MWTIRDKGDRYMRGRKEKQTSEYRTSLSDTSGIILLFVLWHLDKQDCICQSGVTSNLPVIPVTIKVSQEKNKHATDLPLITPGFLASLPQLKIIE